MMRIRKLRADCEVGSFGVLKVFMFLGVIFTFQQALRAQAFVESNGYISIEAESTSSPLGLWKEIKIGNLDYVEGASGETHLEFTGNNQASGPALSPLKYTFTITNGGTYQLVIRSRQRLNGASDDRSNDCYIRMSGDFDSIPSHNIEESLRVDTKFGGAHIEENTWGYSSVLFGVVGEQPNRKPFYVFKEGETYTLTISGRSKNFNMDRITFFKNSLFDEAYAAESLSPGGGSATLGLFEEWIASFPDTNGMDGLDDDPDGDGKSNLYEYGIGSNPTSHSLLDYKPFKAYRSNGSMFFVLVSPQRNDAELRGLTYSLEYGRAENGVFSWAEADAVVAVRGFAPAGFSLVEYSVSLDDAIDPLLRLGVSLSE